MRMDDLLRRLQPAELELDQGGESDTIDPTALAPDDGAAGAELELAGDGGVDEVDIRHIPDWGIPKGLYVNQRWGGEFKSLTGAPAFDTLVRVELPIRYTRDWLLVLGSPTLATGGDPQVDREFEPLNFLGALPTTFPNAREAVVQIASGHGGALAELVVIDYPARGGVLRLHGNYVQVTIADKTTGPTAARYTANLIPAFAALAPTDNWQPSKTMRLGDIAAGANVIGAIPRRARSCTFTTTSFVAFTASVEFTMNGTVVATYFYQASASRDVPAWPEPFLPIPLGANAFRFTAGAGSPMSQVAMRFNLAL